MSRVILPLLLAGCSVAPVQSTTTGITTVDHTTADPPRPTTSTTTDGWGTSSGDPITGEPATTTTTTTTSTTGMLPDFGEGEGCTKIDVVYLLSSIIREENRASVREGIVHFNERLIETFTPNIDMHIMVTDGMIEWPGQACESECSNYGHCDSSGNPDFPCDDLVEAHTCEKTAGASHMFPIGPTSANQLCGASKYVRFIDTQSAPNVLETLHCATNKRPFDGQLTGYPTDAMVKAVTGDGPDDCNQGFLRDDAILFIVYVTFITEGWDWDWTPSPEETATALFSTKGGDKDKLAIAALISDQSQPDPYCQPGYEPLHKNKIHTLVQDLIPHHVWGSICAPDVRPFFDDAIELMLDMCINYVPQ